MDKLLFIYNPHAGQGKVPGAIPDILDAFTYHHYLPTVYPTRARGDAARIVEELGDAFDRVVCCGGDGTLHEVVAGLMRLDDPPVLGYIPAGTTNDFSRNLNLPLDAALAASVAVGGPTARCDMGRFNGEPFVYVAAFGAFTDVSYDTPQRFKNLFGHLAYVLEGMGRLSRELRTWHMRVELEDRVVEDDFIFGMVSNTRSLGGFNFPETVRGKTAVSHVKLDDGLFEVVLVRKPNSAAELQSVLNSLFEEDMVEGGPLLGFQVPRARFLCDEPVAWTLDGEFGGRHRQVTAEAVRKALTICYRPKSQPGR